MKTKAAIIQGALAVGGLVFAYTTWQRAPDLAPDSVTVLDLSLKEVQKIRYETEGKFYEFTRDSSGSEPVAWLHQGPLEEKKPDLGADAGVALPPNHPPLKIADRTLRGNNEALKLFDKFAPFQGTRALGVMEDAKLKELGLTDAPNRKLIVTTPSGDQSFVIGRPVMGMSQPYFRQENGGKVFLPLGSVLMDLEASESRYVDRRLHDFKEDEFDAFSVKTSKNRRELVRDPKAGANEYKYLAAGSDKPDEFAKNWHDKVMRLAAVELLGRSEAPPGGEPTIQLRVEYTFKGKSVGFLEMGKAEKGELYARTEHTAGWVRVPSSAEDLLKEADKVAGS